ncbi:GNAT family N-acetyltransferase [Streptacidiphilus sp. PAMC 29251]
MLQVEKICREELTLEPDAGCFPRLLGDRPHVGIGAEYEGALAGAAFGSTAAESGVTIGFVDLVVTSAQYRRLRLATRMLTELERELARLGCVEIVVRGNPPCHVWPGVDVRYTPAVGFFERAGFTRDGWAVNMTVDLHTAPLETGSDEQRLQAAGITVRRADHRDQASLARLAGCDPSWPANWPGEVARALDGGQGGCFVAVSDGGIVGFSAFGVNRLHLVGPAAVAPPSQGRGIGTVLLRRCLVELRDAHLLDEAELGWVGPIAMYADKMEARIGRYFWQYSKSLA